MVARAWRERRTLLLGLLVLGLALAEGAAGDWVALALADGHGQSDAAGAIGYGIFVTFMTVGRFAGTVVLDRFGRVPVMRWCSATAVVGLALFVFAPVPWLAFAALAIWGLGASLGFPVGMSAAADDPAHAAARVSVVSTIGYGPSFAVRRSWACWRSTSASCIPCSPSWCCLSRASSWRPSRGNARLSRHLPEPARPRAGPPYGSPSLSRPALRKPVPESASAGNPR
ncbi:inner membrane protein YbjJ [Arthrobacter sp. Hiyo8]|nr:inner membrane protein YbjJ [Arthrobacter sp. Hiyo8]